jgi:type II secretory pathway pseudopilin PulG
VLSPGRETGFTLIELLVAMLGGIVIMLATFALIDLTLENTTRITDRVQATQSGRSFLEQTVSELNSGCVADDVSPVQAATPSGISPAVSSDATHLVFVSGEGDSASATPTLHVLSLSGTTLTDTSYAGTGGSAPTLTVGPTWTFATTSSSARVLTNVQSFGLTYYSFLNTANATANSLSGAAALSVPLSSTWPPTTTEYNGGYQVAQVNLALKVGPTDGQTNALVTTTLNDSVVFRLTPPSSLNTNEPCN